MDADTDVWMKTRMCKCVNEPFAAKDKGEERKGDPEDERAGGGRGRGDDR